MIIKLVPLLFKVAFRFISRNVQFWKLGVVVCIDSCTAHTSILYSNKYWSNAMVHLADRPAMLIWENRNCLGEGLQCFLAPNLVVVIGVS